MLYRSPMKVSYYLGSILTKKALVFVTILIKVRGKKDGKRVAFSGMNSGKC